jgi:hypothetical protein
MVSHHEFAVLRTVSGVGTIASALACTDAGVTGVAVAVAGLRVGVGVGGHGRGGRRGPVRTRGLRLGLRPGRSASGPGSGRERAPSRRVAELVYASFCSAVTVLRTTVTLA